MPNLDDLGRQLADVFRDSADLPDEPLDQEDANYVDPGPLPFTCGNCRHIVWGQTTKYDLCQIVDGHISPAGACRFWERKPLTTNQRKLSEQIEGVPLASMKVMLAPTLGVDDEGGDKSGD